MGTRGVIARRTSNGFEGRYHHWDSYPSGLGLALLEAHEFFGSAAAMRKYFIDEESVGWSTICNKNLALPKAFDELHQTKAPQSYQARGESEQGLITSEGSDWGTEWAYVLDDDVIAVFERVYPDGEHTTGMFGYGSDEAGWKPRGEIRWDDPACEVRMLMIEDPAEEARLNN